MVTTQAFLCALLFVCGIVLNAAQPARPQIPNQFESDIIIHEEFGELTEKVEGHIWFNWAEVKGRADVFNDNGDFSFLLTRGDLGFVFNKTNGGNCSVGPFDPNSFENNFAFLSNSTYVGQEALNGKTCDVWQFNAPPVSRTFWISGNTPVMERIVVKAGDQFFATSLSWFRFTPVSRFSPDVFAVPKDCPTSFKMEKQKPSKALSLHFFREKKVQVNSGATF